MSAWRQSGKLSYAHSSYSAGCFLLGDNHPDFFLLKKDKILIKHITLRQNNDTNDFDEELGYRNINQFFCCKNK